MIEIYGALNDRNDPDYKRRNKHADLYYETRRRSKKELWVKKVAMNSGMSEKVIGKIFDHVHTLASRKYNYIEALTAWHKERDSNEKTGTSGG